MVEDTVTVGLGLVTGGTVVVDVLIRVVVEETGTMEEVRYSVVEKGSLARNEVGQEKGHTVVEDGVLISNTA